MKRYVLGWYEIHPEFRKHVEKLLDWDFLNGLQRLIIRPEMDL